MSSNDMLIKRLSLSKIGDLLKDRLGEEAEDYVFPEDFEKAVVDIDFKAIVFEGQQKPYDLIVIGDAVTDIRLFYENANNANAVKSVTFLGGNQTKIAPYLFYGNPNLTELDIPDTMTEIGQYAFQYTGITSLDLSNVLVINGSILSNSAISYVLLNPRATVLQNAFSTTSNLKTMGIEGGGYDIELVNNGHTVFPYINSSSLQSVVVPDGYTDIQCLSASPSLTSVTIPDSVVTIRPNCFYNDSSLLSITANNAVNGSDVTSVFSNCSSLQTVLLPKIGQIGNTYFSKCVSLISVQLGSIGYPITTCTNSAFSGCTNPSTVVTVYTTEYMVSLLLTNIRTGLTRGTIVIKAASNLTYNGTSYQAGDTVVTSTV